MRQEFTGYPMDLFKMYTTDAMAGRHFSKAASACLAAPVILAGILLVAAILPEFSFFAECVNVPNGDVCSIKFQ